MSWLRRLFTCRRGDSLQDALKRIEQLEAEQKFFKAGMSNLQSALIAISSNQEGVAQDVSRIQEAIQELLEGVQYHLIHDNDDQWH